MATLVRKYIDDTSRLAGAITIDALPECHHHQRLFLVARRGMKDVRNLIL